jgi:hypothetical protein
LQHVTAAIVSIVDPRKIHSRLFPRKMNFSATTLPGGTLGRAQWENFPAILDTKVKHAALWRRKQDSGPESPGDPGQYLGSHINIKIMPMWLGAFFLFQPFREKSCLVRKKY